MVAIGETTKIRILSIDSGGTTSIVVGAAIIHLEDQIRLKINGEILY